MEIVEYKELCDLCKFVEDGKDRCLYCLDMFWQFGVHSKFECVENLKEVKIIE